MINYYDFGSDRYHYDEIDNLEKITESLTDEKAGRLSGFMMDSLIRANQNGGEYSFRQSLTYCSAELELITSGIRVTAHIQCLWKTKTVQHL